jgi:hypothetical protein
MFNFKFPSKRFLHLTSGLLLSVLLAPQAVYAVDESVAITPPQYSDNAVKSALGAIPGAGEIQLQGRVSSVNVEDRTFTLNVTGFALPNGKAARLKTATDKIILVSNATQIVDAENRAHALGELEVSTPVTVTGRDDGTGATLPARCIAPFAPEESFYPPAVAEPTPPPLAPQPIAPQPSIRPIRSLPAGFKIQGKKLVTQGSISTFGGPNDTGVGPDEGLALAGTDFLMRQPKYFLATQPPGTTGLARRLNPSTPYIACRWDYSRTPRRYLASTLVTVINVRTGVRVQAQPIDWGPHNSTGRVADLSPGLAAQLGVATDSTPCRIEIPLP